MRRGRHHKPFPLVVLLILGVLATRFSGIDWSLAQGPNETPTKFKVAFLGDQGLSPNAAAVLQLVKDEGAAMVLHQGDFGYNEADPQAPTNWDNQITSLLGTNFPYFGSVGNHDVGQWAEYQQLLQERLDRVAGATCSGDLGVQSFCRYNGLFFILSGAGTMGSDHDTYLRDQLALDDSVWSVCSWHKNQRAMQVGIQDNEVGWGPYEECRLGGAIVATGHEHSYQRTKTLSSLQSPTVDPLWTNPDALRVGGGSNFVFVSGISGQSIRNQDRCLPTSYPYGCNGEWAEIYTSNQGAQYGVLFIEFHVDGDPRKARGYFKNIDGVTVDSFTIMSDLGSPVPPAPPVGLTATVTSSNQIDLAWTDASLDEDGFKLELSLDGIGDWTQISTVAANETTYSDTGLTSSTDYYYRVQTYNNVGDSRYSNLASGTTRSDDGDVTIIFQEGNSGYAGTLDTHVKQGNPGVIFGNLGSVAWDSVDIEAASLPAIGLISFQNIFGTDDWQIPVGATIQSATLTYTVFNAGETAKVHDITVDWAETVTFDSFGGDAGVQTAEYGPLVGVGGGIIGANPLNVTSNLAQWSKNPAENNGWVFLPSGGDGVDFRSSEWHAIVERPKLTVVYSVEATATPVPPPPTDEPTPTVTPVPPSPTSMTTATTSPAPTFTLTPPTPTPAATPTPFPTPPIPTSTPTTAPSPTTTPTPTRATPTLRQTATSTSTPPTESPTPTVVPPTPEALATPLPEATVRPGPAGGGCNAPSGAASVDASWLLLVGFIGLGLVWTRRRR